MRGFVTTGDGAAELRELPVPEPGYGEAVVRVTTTSICATDLKIVDGRFPAPPGRVLGHEAVGEIAKLGPGIEGYCVGERVLVPADTPCGHCDDCLAFPFARGCRTGGTIAGFHLAAARDGTHAEYVSVPFAGANLASIPDEVSDEQAVILACNGTTGFAGVESAAVRIGDTVAIVGQGPVGLSATVAARLRGAGLIVAVDTLPWRLEIARSLGADVVLNAGELDVVAEVAHLTGGRLADVAIEAVGLPETFVTALRLTRAAGTLSTVGNFGMHGEIAVPLTADAWMGGVGEKRIISSTAPGGKDRGRRLMRMIANGRFDLSSLITHRFPLERIDDAYRLFRDRTEPVLKIAIAP
jgi:threonine dehydrogenase-like Zn-dependent dehydrogenase